MTHDIAGRRLPEPVKPYEETYRVDRAAERQAAFVVFDRDYRQADAAKIRAIFYFTPHDTSDGLPVWDVPTRSPMLKATGVDPVSGRPYVDILATGVSRAPYTRSTEPFELVEDTLFYVGDNEVALYLLNATMGTRRTSDDRLVLVDTGWPIAMLDQTSTRASSR